MGALKVILADTRQLISLPLFLLECKQCRGPISVPPFFTPCCFRLLCFKCVSTAMQWRGTYFPTSHHSCPACSEQFRTDDFIHVQPAMPSDKEWKEEWLGCASSKIERVRQIVENKQESIGSCRDSSVKEPPPKIIIFSHFLETLNRLEMEMDASNIGHRILHRNVGSGVRRGTLSSRALKVLSDFKENPLVSVLLIDTTAAYGHDFPFVSTIILMEPIIDLSLETQVIGRARRLDSLHSCIDVYQMVVEETIEEEIHSIRHTIEKMKKERHMLQLFRCAVASDSSHDSQLKVNDLSRLVDTKLNMSKKTRSGPDESLRNRSLLLVSILLPCSYG
uniref:Helicase C-terminal domain-containing protein n=2 Tax=Palpitomonas bilix TaxID=652834 RepID=A0A7S3GCZ5_9EUKA|mmetsp:Transcript_43907/g.114534  ORF Transcript_43907/g.114534 Transcript_43907/m.114534 type:complete len:335 (+) Transcript_43907:102-1106(+)